MRRSLSNREAALLREHAQYVIKHPKWYQVAAAYAGDIKIQELTTTGRCKKCDTAWPCATLRAADLA